MKTSAVVPRDAASLVLLRSLGGQTQVLIGRRADTYRFMPGRYVFPGGQVAASDRAPLRLESGESVGDRPNLLVFKRTAIRETYEETGLLFGRGRPAGGMSPTSAPLSALEHAYAARGLCPALRELGYVGRAITPKGSPMRYHARFFAADGALAHGDLADSGELQDLAWRDIEDCRTLPLSNVTRFMLDRAVQIRAGASSEPVLYYHVRGAPRVRRGF